MVNCLLTKSNEKGKKKKIIINSQRDYGGDRAINNLIDSLFIVFT